MDNCVVTVTLNPALDKTIVLDYLEKGGLNRVKLIRTDPGGKGINVAKVLNNLGVKVEAVGLIAGIQGQSLLEYLHYLDINSNFHKIPGETRVNLKIYEEITNSITEVNEPGFAVSEDDMACFGKTLSNVLDRASFLVLSGSLPKGVPDDIYCKLASLAREKGVRTILDADGKALMNGIGGVPFAIKPNIYELEQLTGKKMASDGDIVQAARQLIKQGIEIVIVSMGGEGSLIVSSNEAFRVRVPSITPKSTVGAGDSMVAAFVYTVLNNQSLEETARFITAAGTATASKPGTEVCTLDEVLQLVNDIKVERI